MDNMYMRYIWDPEKRAETLKTRQLDFADAKEVFDTVVDDFPDLRFDYKEPRRRIFGYIGSVLVHMAYTIKSEDTIRVFSLRKAKRRERKRYQKIH